MEPNTIKRIALASIIGLVFGGLAGFGFGKITEFTPPDEPAEFGTLQEHVDARPLQAQCIRDEVAQAIVGWCYRVASEDEVVLRATPRIIYVQLRPSDRLSGFQVHRLFVVKELPFNAVSGQSDAIRCQGNRAVPTIAVLCLCRSITVRTTVSPGIKTGHRTAGSKEPSNAELDIECKVKTDAEGD